MENEELIKFDETARASEELPITPDPVEKGDNGVTGDGSETSDEFVKVENEELTSDEPAPSVLAKAITEVEVADTKPQEVVQSLIEPKTEIFETKGPVMDLLYWRDIRSSSLVFSLSLLILTSLHCYSSILVFSYLICSLLSVSLSCRIYRFAMQTLNGTQLQNPFQCLLETDISINIDQTKVYIDTFLPKLNYVLISGRDLLLVKNFVPTLKFGVFAWMLSYAGSVFNGLTILTISLIFAFSIPPLYEKYQKEIDEYVLIGKKKSNQVILAVRSKIPGQKPKSQ